ncbi:MULTISPECIES: DUF3256 family protein [Bacteroides]|jgi:hypothetical protein|uniref:DUF3256 family protein n=1 Tax=Bacteroides TaxID=816 RepID=UPI0009630FDC|nr:MULTISPECIES: DUF3256 family protein [Bacteroides]OKZ02550.1 MAG: hypothetical protein BHV73_02060 [Bacteroides sp. 44_46]
MVKKLVVFLFAVCMGIGSLSAQSAKTCFTNMPDSLSPLLTAVNRADFIDFLESKMKAEITNRFGGKSEMTELTPDYICVQVTPQSTWQMKLLSVNDSTRLICTVSTVCAPACDSHIKFYTTDWKELPSAPYLASLPGMDDFIMPASDTIDVYRYQDARLQADMLLMKADLSGKDATLTFTFTTPDYMEREAAEKLKPFLRRPVSYTWKEGKFIR